MVDEICPLSLQYLLSFLIFQQLQIFTQIIESGLGHEEQRWDFFSPIFCLLLLTLDRTSPYRSDFPLVCRVKQEGEFHKYRKKMEQLFFLHLF